MSDQAYIRGTWTLDEDCMSTMKKYTYSASKSKGVISADDIALQHFWNFSSLDHPDASFPHRRSTCYTSDSKASSKLYSNCWRWVPSECKLKDPGPAGFVKLLRQRRTCFVGDSLLMQLVNTARARCLEHSNWQECKTLVLDRFATILFNAYTLRPMLPSEYNYCSEQKHSEGYHGVTGQNASDTGVICLPSKLIDQSDKQHYHRWLWYQGWTDFIEQQECETLIINTGHHNWKEDRLLQNEATYALVIFNVLKYLSEHFRGDIVYVTSEPGHEGCDSHSVPLTHLKELKDDKFHWGLARSMNKVWKDTARQLRLHSFHVMNVSTLVALRADSHPPRDCLHFCEPGINDDIIDLLQALLTEVYAKSRIRHTIRRDMVGESNGDGKVWQPRWQPSYLRC